MDFSKEKSCCSKLIFAFTVNIVTAVVVIRPCSINWSIFDPETLANAWTASVEMTSLVTLGAWLFRNGLLKVVIVEHIKVAS